MGILLSNVVWTLKHICFFANTHTTYNIQCNPSSWALLRGTFLFRSVRELTDTSHTHQHTDMRTHASSMYTIMKAYTCWMLVLPMFFVSSNNNNIFFPSIYWSTCHRMTQLYNVCLYAFTLRYAYIHISVCATVWRTSFRPKKNYMPDVILLTDAVVRSRCRRVQI